MPLPPPHSILENQGKTPVLLVLPHMASMDIIKVHTQEAQNMHQLKRNAPLHIQIYLVKMPLNVNIVKQDLLHKKTVFENFMK